MYIFNAQYVEYMMSYEVLMISPLAWIVQVHLQFYYMKHTFSVQTHLKWMFVQSLLVLVFNVD